MLKQDLHFLHIGKTGGSAIKYAIKNCPYEGAYRIKLHPHSVKMVNIPKRSKVFFSVRDPIQRFVSGFYSRQRKGQPRYFSPWSKIESEVFSFFKTPNDLANSLFTEELNTKELAEMAMRHVHHVNSSYWDWFNNEEFFSRRVSDILFVCRQESLDDDFNKLKIILGLPTHLLLPKDSVLAHMNPKGIDKELDCMAIENLKKWYEKEYKFLEMLKDKDLI